MIEEPDRYIEEFARLGADLINFHIEAAKDVDKTIELIKKTGKKSDSSREAQRFRPGIERNSPARQP